MKEMQARDENIVTYEIFVVSIVSIKDTLF